MKPINAPSIVRSRKTGIDRHCKKCLYDPAGSGGWKQQTEKCTYYACDLYSFRPIPDPTPSEARKTLESPKNVEKTEVIDGGAGDGESA